MGLWFRFSILITAALENDAMKTAAGCGGFTLVEGLVLYLMTTAITKKS
jgi:hypothetical protein